MKSNLYSFTPAEIAEYTAQDDIKRNLGREIDGNRAVILALILACVVVWLWFGLAVHRATEAQAGTVMDGYFEQTVYYGDNVPTPAEVERLGKVYR